MTVVSESGAFYIHAKNLALNVTDLEVKEFFSFCGPIVHVHLKRVLGAEDQVAIVVFSTQEALKTALMLDGAHVWDRCIQVKEGLPDNVGSMSAVKPTMGTSAPTATGDAASASSPSASIPTEQCMYCGYETTGPALEQHIAMVHQRATQQNSTEGESASAIFARMIAKGYVLSKETVDKAKRYDEEKIGLVDKLNTGVDAAKRELEKFDEKYQVSTKTTQAFHQAATVSKEKAKEVDEKLKISESFTNLKTKAMENQHVAKGLSMGKSFFKNMTEKFDEVRCETKRAIDEEEAKRERSQSSTASDVPHAQGGPQAPTYERAQSVSQSAPMAAAAVPEPSAPPASTNYPAL
eukprot:TRINITY_DN6026_c0_g1::TRINITY_DN6026_c0_g1_i1::g.25685::m.25685 TRINITY_DN6026_c0_g1::TRINITY_DN6026_c0_g1_i1::g.25685  ORF type:complete len:351 (+),score=86.13,sp/Q9LFD5/BPA1_ARATH/21.96/1e-11,RRM_1/PF00076.17/2.4e-07,RRM_6/PF14259.1/9.8e-05,zf-H2C2_5/PF13909.1/0.043,DUF3496/PF12001.3/0.26,DUF3496/PF12001.3/3.4e+03 TRINITY_DN6026_c0_g1_i1:62-1114(+)